MANERIVVDPAVLNGKSDEVLSERQKIASLLETAKSSIEKLLGAGFAGEAADAYRSKFTQAHANVSEVLGLLDKQVNSLRTVAGIIKGGEDTATGNIAGLRTAGANIG